MMCVTELLGYFVVLFLLFFFFLMYDQNMN